MLTEFSNALADVAAAAAPSVVQVQGRRRPATGLVYAPDVVLTTLRAAGGEEGIRVRREDGQTADAELAGWDPATSLAVLKVAGLDVRPIHPSTAPVRVGHLALALARSWTNSLTVSAGVVSVIGGPLPTGRRRSIAQVIRTTAPMHEGFSGGAFIGTDGALIGVTTAISIRGSHVVIPAGLAWQAAAGVLAHGRIRRGYLGIAGQPVALPAWQRPSIEGPGPEGEGSAAAGEAPGDRGVLVVAVTDGGPAAATGVLVGDVLMTLNGRRLTSPDDLLELLAGDLVGQSSVLGLLRGGQPIDVTIQVGERVR
ncbi:MAG: serine protease [Acidimicrobiia bacterium]|nr:serine protease [Acidimicrobiia bacterium]